MNSSYRNIIFDRDGIINDVVIRQDTVSSPRNLNEFVLKKISKNLSISFQAHSTYLLPPINQMLPGAF